MTMRTSCLPVFVAVFLVSLGLGVQAQRGQGRGNPSPEAQAAAARYAEADIRVMVPSVIENKGIKRPEFAGVNAPVSTNGEGGQALIRGEGDMALQAICEILPYKEIELVGPLPRELAAWIDMSAGVSAGSTRREDAIAFLTYMTRA